MTNDIHSPLNDLPPCGVYRTLAPIGDDVPAGRLVYFHNHGNPGPGVYLPERWELNRAIFHQRGHTLPQPVEEWVRKLEPVTPEGFYRVASPFHCCDKRCREYETGLFVQLGYDGAANALLFVPEINATGIAVPQMGLRVDRAALKKLEPLKLARSRSEAAKGPAEHLH